MSFVMAKPRWSDLRRYERNMEELIGKVERTAKRESLIKAARPMLKKAKSEAPKDDGHLKRSLKIKVSTYKKDQMIIATIGPDRNYQRLETGENGKTKVIRPVLYAHLQEFGTESHAAQPFMRPAFDGQKDNSLEIYSKDIGEAIKRVAKRFRNQGRFR